MSDHGTQSHRVFKDMNFKDSLATENVYEEQYYCQ
jgi:hypothetical protein